MGKLATLTRAISARSPERETLSAAIARHQSASEHLARVTAASERHYVWPAQEALEQAESALRKAQKREARHLVAVAIGLPEQPGQSVAEAEASLRSAREGLDRAQKTRNALDEELRVAQCSVPAPAPAYRP